MYFAIFKSKKTKRFAVNVHALIEIIVTVDFSNTIRIPSGSFSGVGSDRYVVAAVTLQLNEFAIRE